MQIEYVRYRYSIYIIKNYLKYSIDILLILWLLRIKNYI